MRASEAWPVATERSRRPRWVYVHFGPEDVRGSITPEIRLTRMSASDPLAGLCAICCGWAEAAALIGKSTTLEFMLAPGPGHPRFWMSRVSSG